MNFKLTIVAEKLIALFLKDFLIKNYKITEIKYGQSLEAFCEKNS